MDLYLRLVTETVAADPRLSGWGLRTDETKAVETRDGDIQATLLSVDAP